MSGQFTPIYSFHRLISNEKMIASVASIGLRPSARSVPVLDDCADFALSVKEAYGIWGGMTESDRKKIYAA